MKKSIFAIAILVGLFVAAVAGPAQAQQSFRVQVPFAFVANAVTLPAGEYDIQRQANGGVALLILSKNSGPSAIVMTNAIQSKDWQPETCLVFHRYGNRYFLSQVWTAGDRRGREIYKSPAEKELAKNETPSEVTLLALLTTPKQ